MYLNMKLNSNKDELYSQYNKSFAINSKTFSLAAKFLPGDIRQDITYLYYICRLADDYANDLGKNFAATNSANQTSDSNKSNSTKTAIQNLDSLLVNEEIIGFFKSRKIPFKYYQDLINGIKTDISFVGYQNFNELYEYCYRVAGTVGIMSAHLFGIKDKNLLKKAESLGVAMQITNILRDIEDDSKLGRIYFAKSDMNKFDVKDDQIYQKDFDENLKNLMIHYENLARQYYKIGFEGISEIPQKRIRTSVKYAAVWYMGILDVIKSQDYNPFIGRAYLSKKKKIVYAAKNI